MSYIIYTDYATTITDTEIKGGIVWFSAYIELPIPGINVTVEDHFKFNWKNKVKVIDGTHRAVKRAIIKIDQDVPNGFRNMFGNAISTSIAAKLETILNND